MAARLQISEWLEGEPADDLGAPTPRDGPRPAPEPSDLTALRERLTTARELGRKRQAEDRPPSLPTALPELDRLLEGGLVRGELVELVGGPSSGRFSLVLGVLAAATGVGEAAALVDLGDALQPADAAAAGVVLERLLWLRPRYTREALAGAEMLLGAGFPLVAVDLGVPPVAGGRGSGGAWLRLARTAGRRGAALLLSAPYRTSAAAAARVVALDGRRPLARSSSGPGTRGGAHRPPLLDVLDVRLRLDKARGRSAGTTGDLRLAVPEALAFPTRQPQADGPSSDRADACA